MTSRALTRAALAWALGCAFACRAADEKPLRVLLTTGGHGFQREAYFAFWDALPGVRYTRCELPREAGLLQPGLERTCDVVVLYDMCPGFAPAQRDAFTNLLQTGIGLVATHHSLGAHPRWPEYRRIIGGKWIREPESIDGRSLFESTYREGQDLPVAIADPGHPITRGLAPFTIHDEAYAGFYRDPATHVLLTVDHPQCAREVAWTTSYGRARVCYLMFGHDRDAWRNPQYGELLLRAMRWAARRE